MHIYIDESGIFANPQRKPNSPSVVAALVIATAKQEMLVEEFECMKASWGYAATEEEAPN